MQYKLLQRQRDRFPIHLCKCGQNATIVLQIGRRKCNCPSCFAAKASFSSSEVTQAQKIASGENGSAVLITFLFILLYCPAISRQSVLQQTPFEAALSLGHFHFMLQYITVEAACFGCSGHLQQQERAPARCLKYIFQHFPCCSATDVLSSHINLSS